RTFVQREPEADLDLERFRRVLDQFPDVERVVLHGLGEPLLARELPEMVAEAHRRGARVLFNTNALALHRRLAEQLVSAGRDRRPPAGRLAQVHRRGAALVGLRTTLAVDLRHGERQRAALLLRTVHGQQLPGGDPRQPLRTAPHGDLERGGLQGFPARAPVRRAARTVPGMRHPLDVLRARAAAAVPLLAGALAFAAFAWAFLQRSAALEVPAYDTAFFEQVVWNLGHGHGFTSGFFPANFLGLHFSPLLALPAALELLWPDARLLALLNAAALGLSAPAAYLLLGAILDGRPGGPVTSAVLAAPVPLWLALQQAAGSGFHTEA